jgi:hypothetical protein
MPEPISEKFKMDGPHYTESLDMEPNSSRKLFPTLFSNQVCRSATPITACRIRDIFIDYLLSSSKVIL